MKKYKIKKNNIEEIILTKYENYTTAIKHGPISAPVLNECRNNGLATIRTINKLKQWLDKFGLVLEYREQEES